MYQYTDFLLLAVFWNIHIEGNAENSSGQILDFLAKQNVYHGMSIRQVELQFSCGADPKRIYKYDMGCCPQGRYAAAPDFCKRGHCQGRTGEGTGTGTALPPGLDGEIVRMITRAGTPLVKTGDGAKGQLLVQGQVELVNDSQEITGYDYVCADADIFVRHEISYYDQFSMKNKQADFTQEKGKKDFSVKSRFFFLDVGHQSEAGQQQVYRRTKDLSYREFCVAHLLRLCNR